MHSGNWPHFLNTAGLQRAPSSPISRFRSSLRRGWEGCFPAEALEQFHKSYSELSAKKEAVAVGDGNGLEGDFAGQEQGVFRTGSKAAQGLLDFAPHRFDGVEIGGVRR